MRRRTFVLGCAGAAITSLSAPARGAQLPRIGILATSPPSNTPSWQVFLEELSKLGWIDGRSVTIDLRVTAGQIDRFDELSAELVRADVNVIVAPNPNSVLAARRTTASIPIVMVNTPDPVQLGIVASLARPGGNVTGTCSLSADVSAKQVQLLKELLPGLSHLIVMAVSTNPWHPHALGPIASAARGLNVEPTIATVRHAGEFEGLFAELTGDPSGGMLVLADPMTFFHRAALTAFGMRYRVAAAFGLKEYAEAGGLMSYWADMNLLYQRTAAYVDKLLKGESAANLPIEQPTKYELVINLKTAKAIGVDVPPSLLARADEVIE
jgi:putative ABC transport system substrate-binding protein